MHALTWGAQYRYAHRPRRATAPCFAFLPARVNQTWRSLFVQDEIALARRLRADARRAGRAQRLHRRRVPAERAAGLEARGRPPAVGRGCRARCARRRASTATSSCRRGRRSCWRAGPTSARRSPRSTSSAIAGSRRASVSLFRHRVPRRLRPPAHAGDSRRAARSLFFAQRHGRHDARPRDVGHVPGAADLALARRVHARCCEHCELKPGSNDTTPWRREGPRSVRSGCCARRSTCRIAMELDVSARHVSALRGSAVPAYTAVDLRWAGSRAPASSSRSPGRICFGPRHGEFTAVATRTAYSRAVFAELLIRF